MKNFFFPLFLICGFYGSSQTALNKYQYLIVPTKFDTFKKENQYQTSTLIKYNLVKNGFTVVYDNDLPAELLANRCLGLVLNLIDDSSMFSTKVTLTLKDCLSNVVYTTQEGRSKQKDYKTAYSEAIMECLNSLSGQGYKFESSENNKPATVLRYNNDVKKITEKSSATSPQNSPTALPQKTLLEEPSNVKKEVVSSSDAKTENISVKLPPEIGEASETTNVLYAQAITNGYQLVDSTPKITMWLWNTSVPNVFRAKTSTGGSDGLVTKKGAKWYFEYYEGEKLIERELQIKF